MRPNRKEPNSATFWFQSLSCYCHARGHLRHFVNRTDVVLNQHTIEI